MDAASISSTSDQKKKWFLWGLALVWIPSLPLFVAFLNSFRGITEQKATGLGAVAGGLTEIYLPLSLILTFASLAAAMVFLVRSFSRDHWNRILLSVLSLGWSTLMLFLLSFYLWATFVRR